MHGHHIRSISSHMDIDYDVMKSKHFQRHWPFVRGIHRSPVNSPHKGQWRGALVISLMCAWTNGWINNWNAGDLRHLRAHYDVTVMRYGVHAPGPPILLCLNNCIYIAILIVWSSNVITSLMMWKLRKLSRKSMLGETVNYSITSSGIIGHFCCVLILPPWSVSQSF